MMCAAPFTLDGSRDEAATAADRRGSFCPDRAAGLGQGRGGSAGFVLAGLVAPRPGAGAPVGRPFFERRHQAVLLNADGAQLLAEIGPALEELGQAMERAAGHSELMRLRIAVLPLFASHRLMPRLGALRRSSRISMSSSTHGRTL